MSLGWGLRPNSRSGRSAYSTYLSIEQIFQELVGVLPAPHHPVFVVAEDRGAGGFFMARRHHTNPFVIPGGLRDGQQVSLAVGKEPIRHHSEHSPTVVHMARDRRQTPQRFTPPQTVRQ